MYLREFNEDSEKKKKKGLICKQILDVYCKHRNFRAVHIFAHFTQGIRCAKI